MARMDLIFAIVILYAIPLEGNGAGRSHVMDATSACMPSVLGWACSPLLLRFSTRNPSSGSRSNQGCSRGPLASSWAQGREFSGQLSETGNLECARRQNRASASGERRLSRCSQCVMRGGRLGHGHGHAGDIKRPSHKVMNPTTCEIGDGRTIKVGFLQNPLDNADVQRMVDWEVSAGKELRYDSVQEAHASLGNNATHCVASSIIDEQGEDRVVGAAFLVPRGGVRTSHTCEMIVIVDQSFRGLGIGSSLVEASLGRSAFLGFEGITSGQTYVSNVAAVQLMRRHGFRLVGVEPRAAYLAGRRGATDAMVFYKDTREVRQGRQRKEEGGGGIEGGDDEHDVEMMVAAEELAVEAAERGEVPVGAVVVSREGKIIGKGRNSMVGSKNPCAHAEVLAIQDAASTVGNYRLEGCCIYVTLEPCAMCCGALIHARMSRLVYAAREPKGGCAGSVLDLLSGARFNHAVEVIGGVREEENAAVLSGFFRKRRRKDGQ